MVLSRAAVAMGLVVIAMLASPASSAEETAGGCDDAAYPSLAWTACELANVSISRQNAFGHTDLTLALGQATMEYRAAELAKVLADPERQPNPNLCSTLVACPIDPRLQGWTTNGGLVRSVLFTSRSGATLSGHVWATREGPTRGPGVVFVNGSIFGSEGVYWYVAQTLARKGFVVMTFDAQGEGLSDQLGEAPDQTEDAFAGTPLLGVLAPPAGTQDLLGGNGLPFYDGGQDALDFFLSTPTRPFVPRPSRSTHTSHAAKQDRRVDEGLNNAYNPLWRKLDRSRIGLAGHSYGAQAASWLTQKDRRVDAGVALDSLCVPVSPAVGEGESLGTPNPDFGGVPSIAYGFARDCFASPPGAAPPITKPVLGITGDYLLLPTPYLMAPHPLGKSRASKAWSRAGVDTGQIVIRGGTHLEFNDVPAVVPASLRGIDLVSWYTTAWFAKYLQHDPAADRMLLSRRWRTDAAGGNLFSWHFRSRLDVTRYDGRTFRCEDLRASCTGMVARDRDGWTGTYSFVGAASAR